MKTTKSRILIRDMEPKDFASVEKLLTDPLVMKFIGPGRPLKQFEIDDWIVKFMLRQNKGVGRKVIAIKDNLIDDKFIGICGVLEETGFYDFGFYFMSEYWGKGYAFEACSKLLPEAFEKYGDELIFFVSNENKASLSLTKKLGLFACRNGEYNGNKGIFFTRK